MHRIGDFRTTGAVARGGGVRRGAGGFALPGDAAGSANATGPTATASSIGSLNLLTIQEAPDDPAGRDRQGRRRAQAMLDELAALQRDLLLGGTDPARLERLASLAEGAAAADPVLADALSAIALRAKVEIARYAGRNGRS